MNDEHDLVLKLESHGELVESSVEEFVGSGLPLLESGWGRRVVLIPRFHFANKLGCVP